MHNHVLNYLNEIVKKCPDKVAYSDGESNLTFREVWQICGCVGTNLIKKGITKKPIAVFMHRSPLEIATFFGVVAAGCHYVPLDEEMPAERISRILNTIQSPLMICDETTAEMAKGLAGQVGEIASIQDLACGERDENLLGEVYQKALDVDPIYVVFTSGSTGTPKGVVACHRSVIDYVTQLSEVLGFDGDTVFGNQSPLYFDACLKEVYPTIMFGATDYLIPKKLFAMPFQLIEYLNEHKINTICWVASALTMVSAFSTFDDVVPKYLRTIAFGSEVFPVKHYHAWKEVLPAAKFFNLYGPTEATGMTCFYAVNREFAENEVIPVGRPFDNREVLLLTEDNTLAAEGEQGEICVRGTSVTLGYYNDPVSTAEVFVQNPLNKIYPEIIYRTGDIGRYNERGELVYVSRKDDQIKHMGHRIELGEIESLVTALDQVELAACIYDAEKKKIVLFYVGSVDEKTLGAILKDKLPRYMLPASIYARETFPHTANGKINRLKLKEFYRERIN